MQIDQVKGRCYVPSLTRFNSALELYDFPNTARWVVKNVGSEDIEDITVLLAAPRVKLSTGHIRLSISKDAIVMRPSYFQFVAFPCDSPKTLHLDMIGLTVVSVSLDLPIAYPLGYKPPPETSPTSPLPGSGGPRFAL